ncbi:hypothetical protein J3A83DRAFT_4186389 [Scleroderma citrinum]
MATPIYTPTNYGLSEKVAAYICKHFGYEAFPSTTLAPVLCLDLPVHASVGMDQMVSTLVKAYHNPSIHPVSLGIWTCQQLFWVKGTPLPYGICLVALPGQCRPLCKEHVLGAICPLEHSLKQTRHELGHATWEDDPAILSALATDASRQWLPDICLLAGILSGTLSIMHPPLYDAGLEAMKALRQWSAVADHAMSDALFQWPTVYTNVSVIANHSAPLHCDPHSHVDWYDLFVSLGEYMDCVLDIPTLGLQFDYCPGTVVAFSGRLL